MVDNGGLGTNGFATGTRRYGFNTPDGSFHKIDEAHGRYTQVEQEQVMTMQENRKSNLQSSLASV